MAADNSSAEAGVLTTTTIIATTTTATTTTTSFKDLPGSLLDLHKFCVTDWDEVYEGDRLATREYTTWNALNITRVSLCTWIILSNVAIILLVLGKRVLRVNPKNPLIANMALTNIFLGVFVVPIKQHFILNPATVDCQLEVGWTFIADSFQPSVALFAVVSLVVERFIYVYSQKNQKKILRPALVAATVCLLVLPWLASILFLLPTYLAAFKAEAALPNTCLFKVNEGYFVATQVLSFILPSLAVFILTPYTGLLDCIRPSHCIYKSLTPKGESMAVTALTSLTSIFCEVPYCVVRILMMTMECNNPYCTRFNQAMNIAMWVRIGKAAVFPFIWLCYTDIRKAMLCYLPRNSKRDDDSDDEADGAFQQFRDEAAMEELDGERTKRLYPEPKPSTSTAEY